MSRLAFGLCLPLCVASLSAQSFNVNFGTGVNPPDTYAGVGAPGTWNTVPGTHGVHYTLTGLDGAPTAVQIRNLGGLALQSFDHPGTTGDDESILDQYLVTFTSLETCQRFIGLQNGIYEVITYAWYSQNPAVRGRVTCDESTDPAQHIGGAWAGNLAEGTIYARHIATVTNGILNSHSGLFAGGNAAAFNALQIRKVEALDSLGAGCVGTAGTPTLQAVGTSIAQIGSTFAMEITQVPNTGASVFGVLGLERFWPGLPLDAIGMPGCELYVDILISTGLTHTAGTATWDLSIPNDPFAIGRRVLLQGVLLDPLANPLGATTSNAGDVFIRG